MPQRLGAAVRARMRPAHSLDSPLWRADALQEQAGDQLGNRLEAGPTVARAPVQRHRELTQAAEQQGELADVEVGPDLAALDPGRDDLADPLHERRRGGDDPGLMAWIARERLTDQHPREGLVLAHPLDIRLQDRPQALVRRSVPV